jgi:nucleotide-binding universal stress UspA family protein
MFEGSDMLRRILVPVSHGSASDHGVLEALRLACEPEVSLRFIHVFAETAVDDRIAGFSGSVDDYLDLLDVVERERDAVVQGVRSRAEAASVDFEVVLRSSADGTPCEQVAFEALGWNADLIVMGAHAVGGVGLRPGSQGARILQSSPVPVIVISPRTVDP